MAAHCKHPRNRLTYAGSSTEDAAIGSRWPRKVNWYSCGVCGDEVPGEPLSDEIITKSKQPNYEPEEEDPF